MELSIKLDLMILIRSFTGRSALRMDGIPTKVNIEQVNIPLNPLFLIIIYARVSTRRGFRWVKVLWYTTRG